MATAGTQTIRKAKGKTVTLSAGDVMVALSGDAVLLGEDGVPTAIRLFQAGINKTSKGEILFDEKAAESVLAAQEKYGNEYFFDYDHASLAAFAVDPAHAGKSAAWHRLTVQNGELWTEGLSWTPDASQSLSRKEWRYFSPAVRVDSKSGRVLEYINTALTNRPATYRMKPLVMSQDVDGDEEISPPEKPMPPKILLAALGLSESASEAEALDAVTKVRAAQQQLATLTAKSDASEILGVVAAWKAKAEEYSVLSAKMEKLEADRKEAEVVAFVDEAVKAGKLPPVLKEQALTFGRQNFGFVKAFIETLSSKVEGGQLQPKKPEGGAVTAELETIVKSMGLKLDDVAKHQAPFLPMSTKPT